MVASSDKELDFDCPICMLPIDIEDAFECLNCEIKICRGNSKCIEVENDKKPCPVCKSTDGFKKKLSRQNKFSISNL